MTQESIGMTKRSIGKSGRKVLAGLPLMAVLALGYPLLFNATPAEKAAKMPPGQAPEVTPADGVLTFFHGEFETRLENPAGALKFPHLMDPGALINLRTKLTLKKGDTLMNLLVRGGVERRQAFAAIEALSATMDPRKIKIDQEIYVTQKKALFRNDIAAELKTLTLPLEFGQDLVVSHSEDAGFQSRLEIVPTTSLKMVAEGVISDSLYLSALREGAPVGVITDMIRLFSFDVDFQREIWSGDKFSILFERRMTHAGKAENNGKVLAATLILRGKPLTFYRFEKADGSFDFYTADGKSARKMLMKTPVDGARLSSRFGNRKHPVLGYTRAHKGVDFAAPRGTPIMAAGDGVIERSSRYGAYGNYVRIRHNGTYKTAYAHLSAYGKGIRSGVRVKQGRIIGYVGATGRVTGVHLHYEILMNGAQINPLTLKMPDGRRLEGRDLQEFGVKKTSLEADLDALRMVGILRAELTTETAGQEALPGS